MFYFPTASPRRANTCSHIIRLLPELPTPELVENRRRSIAMLPSGVPALDRDEALELSGSSRRAPRSAETEGAERGAVTLGHPGVNECSSSRYPATAMVLRDHQTRLKLPGGFDWDTAFAIEEVVLQQVGERKHVTKNVEVRTEHWRIEVATVEKARAAVESRRAKVSRLILTVFVGRPLAPQKDLALIASLGTDDSRVGFRSTSEAESKGLASALESALKRRGVECRPT
jgi:hypothetical protein